MILRQRALPLPAFGQEHFHRAELPGDRVRPPSESGEVEAFHRLHGAHRMCTVYGQGGRCQGPMRAGPGFHKNQFHLTLGWTHRT